MLCSDLALFRRLDAAEGYACRQFALARRRLFPESHSEAIRAADTDVVFDYLLLFGGPLGLAGAIEVRMIPDAHS